VTYVEQLRDPRWLARRAEILDRDGVCRGCRDEGPGLEVHHKRYSRGKLAWEYPPSDLVTLCRRCHERTTRLLDEARDILASLNVYELPIAIAALRAAAHAETDEQALERLNAERDYLVAGPFTRTASARVEEIDAEIDRIEDRLAAEALAAADAAHAHEVE
jgi:hypothetical protein